MLVAFADFDCIHSDNIGDANIEMVKKYEEVLADALDILLDICSGEELRNIKFKADPKISQVKVKITAYLSVKGKEIERLEMIIEETLKEIEAANTDLAAEGKPTIPPPSEFIPEATIAAAVVTINTAAADIATKQASKSAVAGAQFSIVYIQNYLEGAGAGLCPGQTSTSTGRAASPGTCADFRDTYASFLDTVAAISDENIVDVLQFVASFSLQVEALASCSTQEREELSSEVTGEVEAALDQLLVFGHGKVEEVAALASVIQEALQVITEANTQLAEAGKPTLAPPTIDVALPSTAPATTSTTPTPAAGADDVAVIIVAG